MRKCDTPSGCECVTLCKECPPPPALTLVERPTPSSCLGFRPSPILPELRERDRRRRAHEMFRNQYDTDVTVWSPQGHLHQIDYAMEAVKQGSVCLGLTSNRVAVLCGLKRQTLELAEHQNKVFKIDDHMGIAISGLTADARTLARFMRTESLNHKFVYGSAITVGRLVSDVADKKQECTQSYIRRPYGVGLLVAGVDVRGCWQLRGARWGDVYSRSV